MSCGQDREGPSGCGRDVTGKGLALTSGCGSTEQRGPISVSSTAAKQVLCLVLLASGLLAGCLAHSR